jgi:DNA-binding transcriptional LysR family regulator
MPCRPLSPSPTCRVCARGAQARSVAVKRDARMIAALEERLGARLLQRTTRQVARPMPAPLPGARPAHHCRCRGGESSAEGERTRPGGRLAVSAPIGFGRLHVSPVMSAI